MQLLTVPWGLFGSSSEKINLVDGQTYILPAGTSPLLFGEHLPELDGSSEGLQVESAFRTPRQEQRFLWAMPAPLHAADRQVLVAPGWTRGGARLAWKDAVSIPAKQPGAGEAGDDEGSGTRWLGFTRSLVGRMRDLEEAVAADREPWLQVLGRWIDPGQTQDASMDVLVRHAREYRPLLSRVADRPRRILSRRRELTPLGRVQELDTRCMEWLSRQPGRTIPERADARQRILALARYENENTLENRVLRDHLERTAVAAREYLEANPNKETTNRYRLVESYGTECRLLSRSLAQAGVARAVGNEQPNFVLLQDSQYRQVWKAYQDILRRKRAEDETWRWQRRAWAEFCKACAVTAALALPHSRLIAASPLRFRAEHRRGEWLVHDEPLAVVLNHAQGWVVEILSGHCRDLPHRAAELGASTWLRFGSLDGSEPHYAAIWALHGHGPGLPLHADVESANNALSFVQKLQIPVVGGVILRSRPVPQDMVAQETARLVTGIALDPADTQLCVGLDRLGQAFQALAERLQLK